jgi:hypothetical protein
MKNIKILGIGFHIYFIAFSVHTHLCVLFVTFQGSRNFITGNEALKHVLDNIPELQRPELLKFPTMRKYLATVVQVNYVNFL